MNLEERAAGQPMDRKTFIKIGGAVIVGGIAAWLGLNWHAPDSVPGPKQIKYYTMQEIVDDTDSGNCKMKSFEPGDIIHIRDVASDIIYSNSRLETTVYVKMRDGQGQFQVGGDYSATIKRGDTFIATMPVVGNNDCFRPDDTNHTHKNTLKKA